MSEMNLREAVESLRKLTPRLNDVTNLANETVRKVEAFLNDQLSVGVEALVKVKSNPEDYEATYLEYRRVGGKFRIAVCNTDPDGVESGLKPWSDCTRDVKLETFAKLPELLINVAHQVQQEISKTEAAALEVADSISLLRAPQAPADDSGEPSFDSIPF